MYTLSKFACTFMVACICATAGAVNTALDFNGLTDHITLTTNPLSGKLNGYTLEAWTLSTTSTGVHRIMSDQMTTPSRGFGFGTRAATTNLGNIRLTTYGIQDYDTAANTYSPNAWTHLAVVLSSGNNASFYKNGQFVATINTNSKLPVLTSGTLSIGRNAINETGTEYWQGKLDDLRIWNYERTGAEILADMYKTLVGNEAGLILYLPFSEGSGTAVNDLSPTNADGTITGAQWVTDGVSSGSGAKDWSIYP